MSSIATYRVVATWFNDAEVTLQVDHSVLTKELANLINEFWGGDEDRLAQENGDVVRAVVRLFGTRAISFFMADGGAGLSVESRYWTEKVIQAQHEGWPDCSGLGILIVAASVDSVDYDDVTLEGGTA